MKHFIILLMLALCVQSHAQKAEADSAYSASDYAEAIALYDSLLATEGPSVEAYYNLGCCHYRLDDVPRAILCFERALRLEPGDDDVRTNLQMARAKTIDKIIPHHEIFFVVWWRQLVGCMSVGMWAQLAILSFLCMLCASVVFLFGRQMWLKKTAFGIALLTLLTCIGCNACAWSGRQNMLHRPAAIVMSASAVVRSTPAKSGVELFVLHEGTRIDITDDSMHEWKEIELADGKKGWIERNLIERI